MSTERVISILKLKCSDSAISTVRGSLLQEKKAVHASEEPLHIRRDCIRGNSYVKIEFVKKNVKTVCDSGSSKSLVGSV